MMCFTAGRTMWGKFPANQISGIQRVARLVLCVLALSMNMWTPASASIFNISRKVDPQPSGYTVINVCVSDDSASNQRGDGADAGLIHDSNPSVDTVVWRIRNALQSTWEVNSSIRFVGWKRCSSLTTTEKSSALTLLIQPDLDNYYSSAAKRVQFATWGKNFNRCIDFNWRSSRVEYSYDCAEQYAIHEFGHALGFEHEMRSYSAYFKCQDKDNVVIGQYDAGYVYTSEPEGSYDLNSIMAYKMSDDDQDRCVDENGVRFGTRTLSPTDQKGLEKAYPVTLRALASSELDFGGAYGVINNGQVVNNPATGARSCPAGYTDVGIYGAANVDWSINFCYRPHQASASPIYDFGGMWGYVDGQATKNPITGTSGCPGGYADLQLLGTDNRDWPLHVCYRAHGDNPALRFGGVMAYKDQNFISNQVTLRNECPLGYARQEVLGQHNVDFPFSYCYAKEPKQIDGLDFGGAYGYVNDGEPVNNPITNAQSCPATYTATRVFGTNGTDWSVYLCHKPHISGTQAEYDFGGMWGYVDDGRLVANPLTGTGSCAADYTAIKLLDTYDQDWPLHVCYRRHTSSDNASMWFGGVVGTVEGQAANNPATRTPTCPAGYGGLTVLGTINQDWTFAYCFARPVPAR